LVPVPKQPGLKAGAFSRALLVPVAATGINRLYKPGLKAFFPPVSYDHGLIQGAHPELWLMMLQPGDYAMF
jgi:hypothetical protein